MKSVSHAGMAFFPGERLSMKAMITSCAPTTILLINNDDFEKLKLSAPRCGPALAGFQVRKWSIFVVHHFDRLKALSTSKGSLTP
jgi:hypothetical protein